MRIAVIGTGAVGGYFGGRLAAAGADVTFFARGDTLEALRRRGLRVDSPNGDISLPRVAATDDPAKAGRADLVLVAVKAWQVPRVAESLIPLLDEQTTILPRQNGVEAAGQLAAALGEKHVLGGSCRIITMQTAPGHIRHVGVEPFITFGELNNRHSERVDRLLQVFRQSGISSAIPPDIDQAIWKKFLFVAPAGGMCAVTRTPVGPVRTMPETRELLCRAMEEIRRVAAAKGILLPEEIIDKTLSFLDSMPAEATSSMQRDIMEGRPSELESHNGAVVRMGRAAGIETPVNGFIYSSLLPMENEARRRCVTPDD